MTSTSNGTAAPSNAPYTAMRGRIRAFLQAQGGASHEDALIRHVFGPAGSPDLWRSLLRQILGATGDDLAFEYRADGHWALPSAGTSPDPTTYIVLDVETTGLKPSSQRIIEIAAIRYQGGREDDIFSTLVQPGRPLPAQIVSLTRITDDLLAEAPPFVAIAADLLAFLGDAPIVGHNIAFDLAFLDAEVRRAGHHALLNPRLDTLALSQRILAGQRRWKLDAVARSLGVRVPRQRHRAEPDARLTAAVFDALLRRAPERGLHSLDDLFAVAGSRGRELGDPAQEATGRGRAVMDPAWLADIPHLPGCYLMRDAQDVILYVGKAKDLQNRVRSYYSQALVKEWKPGLLEAIARIETIVVGSELEALLLETQLIRRHAPRYNVQGRHHEQYPYIKVDLADAWPRVTRTRRRLDDGGRYFGPFRNPRVVRRALEALEEVLPLRTCRQRAATPDRRWAPCLRLNLGQCLGPCVGQTTPEAYGAVVADLLRFLAGDADVMIARLQAQRESLATRGFSMKAQQLEYAQRSIAAIAGEGALITAAVGTDDLLLVLPSVEASAVEALLLTHGRLWARTRVGRDEAPAAVAERLRRSWTRARAQDLPPIDHESIDETATLVGWLRRRGDQLVILPLPADDTDAAWQTLAAAVIAARPQQDWTFAEVDDEEDEGEEDWEDDAEDGEDAPAREPAAAAR